MMNYKQVGNKVIVTKINNFNISEILECGQCFRFHKLNENEYKIIAHNKILNIKQFKTEVEFYPTDIIEFENIWIDYFDLNTDYDKIKAKLIKNDLILKDAIEFADGIRILNQDPWECIISFIISQNNRIPMIKKVIENICSRYGEELSEHHSFPSAHNLLNVQIDELLLCKTGFRAKYIVDAIHKINNNIININNFSCKKTDILRQDLMSIQGIGPKVADCILLFSCKRREVFPTDVWVKRVMQYFYFDNKEVSIKQIHSYAKENWGNYAGYAQQYLFHYARQQKIGIK